MKKLEQIYEGKAKKVYATDGMLAYGYGKHGHAHRTHF